jgi:lipopolysaccharide transport system permease protein
MTSPPATTHDPALRVAEPGLLGAIAERSREVWGARGLLLEFALRDVRVRYRQAVLGIVWALLVPGLTILAGLVLRAVIQGGGGIAGGAGGGLARAMADGPLVLAGIALKGVAWAFFAGAVGSGTTSLSANGGLVARVYFPREVLPLATTLAQAVDLGTGLLATVVMFAVLGVGVGPTVLWAPLLLVMLVALTASIAAVLACVNLFFRDVRHVVQVLVTFGVFFTPVFVEAWQLGARGARLAMLNPVAPLLEGLRLAVVAGHDLLRPLVVDGILAWTPWYLAYALGWTAVLVGVASLLYSRLGSVFAEYL